MSETIPTLKITPAISIPLGYLPEALLSEWNGLGRLNQDTLMSNLLIPGTRKEYIYKGIPLLDPAYW